MQRLTSALPVIITMAEKVLAALILCAVVVYVWHGFLLFLTVDWSTKEVFYDLIYRILLVTIGLEAARMLFSHNYASVLELLAFVVARKMLSPDLTSVDILLGIISFAAILAAHRYLIDPAASRMYRRECGDDTCDDPPLPARSPGATDPS